MVVRMPYDVPGSDGATAEADAPRADARPAKAPAEPPREQAKAASDQPGEDEQAKQADTPRRRPWVWVVVAIVVLAIAIGGFWYWESTKDEATTDDAYTDGRAISIAPQVSGDVVDLAVNDNQFVHAGDVLLRIDPRLLIASRDQARGQLEAAQGQLSAARAGAEVARVTFPAKLAAARAQRDSAQATLTRADQDLRRQQSLSRGATTQQDRDQAAAAAAQAQAQLAEAEANLRQAQPVDPDIAQVVAQASQWEGQVAQAKAQLDTADLNLGYATVVAPQDGWVTKRNVEKGNYVTAGAEIMSLVSPQVWVTANYKESQLDRMRPGQHVLISVDAYPGLKLQGHVDSIQLGTGGRFTAFPAENATGNFVKIVQRVPVKIDIDSGLDPNLPLPLGLSVDPIVELK
jgi:membrane fusion protein (multidrug efflux system)